jgi:hypothetical protein
MVSKRSVAMVVSIRLAVGGAHRSQLLLGADSNFTPEPRSKTRFLWK